MLHITPELVVGVYELLRQTPPFKRWKLPPSDEVEFHITKHKLQYADHAIKYKKTPRDGHHLIRVSLCNHTHLDTLLRTMAHEMVHARQHVLRIPMGHGPSFKKMAHQVCRIHGWDEGAF